MQKWEYCLVGPIKVMITQRGGGIYEDTGGAMLIYLLPEGQKAYLLSPPPGAVSGNVIATTIAQLGSDGWELVGAGNVSESYHSLYFKRPKEG